MNFSELGNKVRLLINEDPSVINFYTSTDLSAVINDAQLDVVMDFPVLQNSGTVYTEPNVYQYALSASYMTNNEDLLIEAVFYNGSMLTPTNINNERWSYGETKPTGTPKYYRIFNRNIELDPTPTEAKPLVVYYRKRPATMVDATATPDLPIEYHMAIVYLASAYLTCKDKDALNENKYFQRYQMKARQLQLLKSKYDQSVIPIDATIAKQRRHPYPA